MIHCPGAGVAPRRAALGLLVLLAGAAGARADDPVPPPPAENAPDATARDAIETFRRDFAVEDWGRRVEALDRLRCVVHPDVAAVLLDLALEGKDCAVRASAFRGLTLQRNDAKALGPRVDGALAEAAKEIGRARAKWDYGILLDRKTGEPDLKSPEGKAALLLKRERGKMLSEAVRLLGGLGWRGKETLDSFRVFLGDGNDDLLVHCMEQIGRWKEWTALPDLQAVFDMYPNEEEFSGGSMSVDTDAPGTVDQDAAKRRYNAKFGDPDRMHARPRVVIALKKALLAITGEKIETAAALKAFLLKPEVRKKVRGK
jgi:hypothetical protein